MELEQNLLFFFSGLGVFNGLLLSLYFFFRPRPRHISNYFLGFFFLSLSIRIGKSVVFFFDPELAFSYLQLGLMFCAFIGPALYLYCRAVLQPAETPFDRWKLHLGIIVPLVFIGGWGYPYADHVSEWRQYVVYGIYTLWAVYSAMAVHLCWPVIQGVLDPKASTSNRDKWILSLLVGNAAILAAYVLTGITSYILGAVLFSFMLYSVIWILFRGNKKDPILLRIRPRLDATVARESSELLQRMEQLVGGEQLYLRSDLKLADVAQRLQVSSAQISKTLNEFSGQNFAHFLNSYRVQHAQELIRSGSPYTMEALGYDSGFNSKSSFYATFKKHSGQTPKEFREYSLKKAG